MRLKRYDGKTWSAALDVTDPGLDIWRPSVAVVDGRVHVSWSQQVGGKWDICHRVYTPPGKGGGNGQWSRIVRVGKAPATDFNVVSTASPRGTVWLAWQSCAQGRWQIVAREVSWNDADKAAVPNRPETKVTTADANHWSPAITADAIGKVYIAYDTYAKDNYDVRVAEIGGAAVKTVDIAVTPRFEARPSIVCDQQGRLWIAYEEGDEQWGKDYATAQFAKIGFKDNPGRPLYLKRTVRVKCLVGDSVQVPAGDLRSRPAPTARRTIAACRASRSTAPAGYGCCTGIIRGHWAPAKSGTAMPCATTARHGRCRAGSGTPTT